MEFNDPNWWHRSSFWLEGPSTESRSIGADLSGGKETSTYLLVCEMRRQAGTRTGNWLTKQQAEALIQAPDIHTLKGKRDRAILALLIGTGLRRSEASALTFDHVQQREGRWAIVDLRGKGNRIRTVPMPSWTKAYLDVWATAAGLSTGYIFRPLNNRHELTRDRLLEQ